TAQASGSAVEIAANNVTIDCNGFKIGGLAAGDASTAAGIHADGYRNAVARNCSIGGFHHGIHLTGGSGTLLDSTGHLAEDSRIDNSPRTGIRIHPGRGTMVRRERVFDPGGAPDEVYAPGIYAQADVVDNLVARLFATGANGYPRAINVYGGGNLVSGNIAYGMVPSGPSGTGQGIYMGGRGNLARDNHVHLAPSGAGIGIRVTDPFNYCAANTVGGFATPIDGCVDAGGNHDY